MSFSAMGLTGRIGHLNLASLISPIHPLCPTLLGQIPPGPSSPDDQLDDIRPPYFYSHSWFWVWLCLAIAIAAAVALIFLFFFCFRARTFYNPQSAYDLALEKLEQARALLREDNPMPYAILVSETVRSYLGQRFHSPSTRRTTEEFLRQMEADRATPLAEHRDLLREFLCSCDLVKFALYQPTLTELEQVQQRATSFVMATKPLPETAHKNGR